MDKQMYAPSKHRTTIYYLILFVILMLTSCRSTINEPVTQTTLNSVDQIDTLNREDPDNRGIITYDTYQILIANGSETISEIANRLNINEEKLALYNGLIPNYRPRKNEMIALPEDQFISPSGWSTEITRATIENEQSSQQKISSANNPLRHRVKEGETVYSLAREYKVSVNSIAAWNGLGPDLDIKTGREIIIPAATSSLLKTTQSKKTSEVKINERKEPSNIKEQKSIKTVETKLSDKKKNNTPEQKPSLPEVEIISVKPFIAPVMGIIVSKYSQDKGSQNNNGIDYETEIGSSVNAVADGKIVLVSDIVGGNGKIVLIRHDSELITIYGRLTNVTIEKDQDVDQGQNIGVVIKDSQTSKGLMHFEVRKGMKSVDPETMIR